MTRLWLSLLALLAFNAFAQTPLTDPVYAHAPGDQNAPVVVTNGTDFLVTWLDARALPASIYANRVSRDGRVLDGTGIRIPLDPPSVNITLCAVRAGGAYVVIFGTQHFLADGSSAYATNVARISDDGQLIDGPRVVLDDVVISAASNGSRIVVIGQDRLAILNDRAELLARDIPAPSGTITSNGTTFLIVSFASNGINFTTLDASGATVAVTAKGANANARPAIGSDGSGYLVLYNDVRLTGTATQVVNANGSLGASGTLSLPMFAYEGTLVWTGSKYLLVAATSDAQQQIAVATVSRSGEVVDPPRTLGPGTRGATNNASGAWNGAQALLVWTSGAQDDFDAWEVTGELVNATSASLTAPQSIPSSGDAQITPVIAGGGVNQLIAWLEPSGIYATRITLSGSVLDRHPILVSPITTNSRTISGFFIAQSVRVVFDGDAYLVAWADVTGLHGQRVDDETGALAGPPLTIASSHVASFDMGRDDAGVLVVAALNGAVFFAQRVGVSGPVGGPASILAPGMLVRNPRLAWNGGEWLVVFENMIQLPVLVSPPLYRGNVYAERLSSALAVLDPQPIPIAVSDDDEASPMVATDGSDFLVAWSHYFHDQGLRGRAVRADGSVGETLVVTPEAAGIQSIVWDGARYAIAFAARTNDFVYQLWLTHVRAAPAGDRIAISADAPNQRNVTLIATGRGAVRAAYDRVSPEPEYGGVARVYVRDIGTVPRRRASSK